MSVTLVLALMLAPQKAPSAADLADAKCAAAMITVSEQLKDASQKAGVDAMLMYYIGKIVGRSGSAAVKPGLEAAAALIDAAALPKLAETCATEGGKVMEGM
ncbi:hypothetical protein M9978_19650 [Sphingomonas sp. MG17]|jgi:hypothetical protein|uniref:Uncharacterized protein n=1 Tax=Sphingomonas tagetis TaxID=2949092 RepID=A0A9X2HNQ1_9SPHN|nr:hypothetical protein [Sphingomonas tagetis]MCP3732644.1 hypothetical protein [Sphingomonas tagetis]